MTHCFATGCAWRAIYIYTDNLAKKGQGWHGKEQIFSLGIDPVFERGPEIFGNIGKKFFRFKVPYLTFSTAFRYSWLLPVYRVQQKFWHRLDGRRNRKPYENLR